MDHLPPELIELVIDNLLNETEALKACSLTSRALLPRLQVHLLESIALSFENMKDIQARVSSDPCRTLFRTRILRIYDSESIQPHDLDEVLDAFMAFKNVRGLRLQLSATHFVGLDFTLTSHYFAHLQPTLRSLQLMTPRNNPKDLIAFIAFFPFLEEVTLIFFQTSARIAHSKFGELDPNQLHPLRGTLRIYEAGHSSEFIRQLSKVQVHYHTIELPEPFEMELNALIAACAPTLRVLQLTPRCTSFFYPLAMDYKLIL